MARTGERGQEETSDDRDDGDNGQQFYETKCFPQKPVPQASLRRFQNLQADSQPIPIAANAVTPGSGTTSIVRTGRLAGVEKLRELKTALTLPSAANRRRLKGLPDTMSPTKFGASCRD